jgi:diacylglycerol kinase family enzyme
MQVASTYDFPVIEVESEDLSETVKGPLVVVANSRFHAGYFQAVSQARLDDGYLDLVALPETRIPRLLQYLAAARRGQLFQQPGVKSFRFRKAVISAPRPVPIHTDAEVAGLTPCEFECIPAALQILAPAARLDRK